MSFAGVAPLVGSAITLALGAMGLVAPRAASAFTGTLPDGLIGTSEIRATYGGFFLALGAFCLATRDPTAFTVLGVAWVGAALGRFVSVLVDGSTSAKNWGGIGFEAAIGALLLAPAL